MSYVDSTAGGARRRDNNPMPRSRQSQFDMFVVQATACRGVTAATRPIRTEEDRPTETRNDPRGAYAWIDQPGQPEPGLE
jgi:hypothetical protein